MLTCGSCVSLCLYAVCPGRLARFEKFVDLRVQGFERRFQKIRAFLDPDVRAKTVDESVLAVILDIQAGRNPHQTRKGAFALALDSGFKLQHAHGLLGSLRNYAVVFAYEMYRQATLGHRPLKIDLQFLNIERQRTIRKHPVAVRQKVTSDGIAPIFQLSVVSARYTVPLPDSVQGAGVAWSLPSNLHSSRHRSCARSSSLIQKSRCASVPKA